MHTLIEENKILLLKRHLYLYFIGLMANLPREPFPNGTVTLGPKKHTTLDMDYDSKTNQLTFSYHGKTETIDFLTDKSKGLMVDIARHDNIDPYTVETEIYHRMMPVFDYWVKNLSDKREVALLLLAILSQGGTGGSFSVIHEGEVKEIQYYYRRYSLKTHVFVIKPGNYREIEISLSMDVPRIHIELESLVRFLQNTSPVHEKYSWEKLPLVPILELETEIFDELKEQVLLAMSMHYYEVLTHEAKGVGLPGAYEDFLELSSSEQTELFDEIFKDASSPIPRRYAETILFLTNTTLSCKRKVSNVVEFEVRWDTTRHYHDVASHNGYGVVGVYVKDQLLTKYILSNREEHPNDSYENANKTLTIEYINEFDMFHPCVKLPFSPVSLVRKCPDLMAIWLMFHM